MSLYDDLVRENADLRKSQAANEAELRRADETIGALRKRASEAELERDSMLSACVSACVSAGWYAEGGDPEGFIRALRKRVEELEQAHAVCLSVHKDVESCLAAEERAEKAERERDNTRAVLNHLTMELSGHLGITGTPADLAASVGELMMAANLYKQERDSYRRDFDACAHALDKLQADLDAALDWIESVGGPMRRGGQFADRVVALLEKRREKRG